MGSFQTQTPLETCLHGPLSRQVLLYLGESKFDRAREACRSHLVGTPLNSPEQILPRFEAIGNLVLIALKTKDSLGLDWTLGTLKSDVDEIATRFRNADQIRELCRQLVLMCETMGSLRMWASVKSVTRMVLRLLVDEKPPTQGLRIRALNNLGSSLLSENRIEDAAHVWQCAIKDYDPKLVDHCAAQLSTLHNNLGELLRLQCRFAAAGKHHQRALQLRLDTFPLDDPLVRQSRYNLAQVLIETHAYDQAALEVEAYLESFPPDSEMTADLLKGKIFQCRLLFKQGLFQSAETQINSLARSIAKDEARWGRQSVELHLWRLALAQRIGKANVVQSEIARLPEMIISQRLESSIHEGRLRYQIGQTDPELDISPMNADREHHLQTALQLLRKRLVRTHPLMGNTIFALADLFQNTGRGQRAVQSANGAVILFGQTFGETSAPYVYAMTRLGNLLESQQQTSTLLKLMKQAVRISRKLKYVPALTQLQVLDLLSRAYEKLNNPRMASYLATASIRISSRQLELPTGEEDLLVDRAIDLSEQVGHFDRVVELLQRRIELLTAEHHANHPQVASCVEQLGRAYARQGKHAEAAEHLANVLTVRCTDLGEESPLAIELMQLTAEECRLAGMTEQAEEIHNRAQLINDKSSHVLSDLL